MKLRMYIEVDVSKSLADTMRRNGFSLERDGSGMKIIVPNSPVIPRRKVKVQFLDKDQK